MYKAFTYSLLMFFLFSISSLSFSAQPKEKGNFFGNKHTDYPSWFKESFLDFNDDLADAKSAGKRIMVFFHQDGCPYCNALVEKNLSQKDIQDKVRKNFDVIAMNMWGDREVTYVNGKQYTEKTLAEALRVQFTPTVIFYNENGKVVLRLNGYRAPNRFNVELDYVANHKEKEMSARDYIKANLKTKPASKKLHSEDFFDLKTTNFNRKSKPGNKPLAVFFEQKDCPNCDNLHNNVLPDKTTRKILHQFNVAQLDMWSRTPVVTTSGKKMTAREWAKKLDIKFSPSIILFDENGEEVIRSEGIFKVFHTQSIFEYVLDKAYKKQPSFQRYLSDRAEHFREQGIDVDIWALAGQKPAERD